MRKSPFQPELPGKPRESLYWGRLYGSSKALAISKVMQKTSSPLVIITADMLSANHLLDELKFYTEAELEVPLLSFPDWETLPYDLFSPYQDIISERLSTLARLPSLKQGILVVPITTIMHRLMPKEFLLVHSLKLQTGQSINIEEFKRELVTAGYTFGSQVVEHGDAVVRGSIIDVFPMGATFPFRIDLFDNEIDSIRTFDPETQRSIEKVEKINILPAKEVALIDENIAHFRANWRARFEGNPGQSPVYRDVSQGLAPAGMEYYLPLFYQETSSERFGDGSYSVSISEGGIPSEWRHIDENGLLQFDSHYDTETGYGIHSDYDYDENGNLINKTTSEPTWHPNMEYIIGVRNGEIEEPDTGLGVALGGVLSEFDFGKLGTAIDNYNRWVHLATNVSVFRMDAVEHKESPVG